MPKQMRVFYDTEFLEDGKTIDLISYGAVRADGKEFYAVSIEADYRRILQDEWLMKNVMNSIEHEIVLVRDGWDNEIPTIKITDPAAMTRRQIRDGIMEFVADIWPEFWAWYGAYDHVAMCQLFGKMIDLPNNFPMFTCDIRQLYKEKGMPAKPEQAKGNHNALGDARYNKEFYEYLKAL